MCPKSQKMTLLGSSSVWTQKLCGGPFLASTVDIWYQLPVSPAQRTLISFQAIQPFPTPHSQVHHGDQYLAQELGFNIIRSNKSLQEFCWAVWKREDFFFPLEVVGSEVVTSGIAVAIFATTAVSLEPWGPLCGTWEWSQDSGKQTQEIEKYWIFGVILLACGSSLAWSPQVPPLEFFFSHMSQYPPADRLSQYRPPHRLSQFVFCLFVFCNLHWKIW